jgi:predicted sugar kinase
MWRVSVGYGRENITWSAEVEAATWQTAIHEAAKQATGGAWLALLSNSSVGPSVYTDRIA